ncbi:hypothetical protein VTK56DRAFT_1980 [Thermocarpiscus australiensis]
MQLKPAARGRMGYGHVSLVVPSIGEESSGTEPRLQCSQPKAVAREHLFQRVPRDPINWSTHLQERFQFGRLTWEVAHLQPLLSFPDWEVLSTSSRLLVCATSSDNRSQAAMFLLSLSSACSFEGKASAVPRCREPWG